MTPDLNPPQHDIDLLRRLGARVAEIADDPVNAERRDAWHRLDAGGDSRVMVLAESGGVKDERKPFAPALECEDEWARGVETGLRRAIWQFEELRDDHVVEPWINVGWKVEKSDYGVQAVTHRADVEFFGARRWDPPIVDIDRDFDKLTPRTFSVDREGTLAAKARMGAVLDGVLPVRIRSHYWWTMGLTMPIIDLIGLEGLMLAMYDNPAGLHRIMGFLRDDHLAFAQWLQDEGLLCLNNENDYIGSGSVGCTRALPAADRRDGDPVRMKDLWVLLESQETVNVGPAQFEEFVFPYQNRIAERFGRVYYGCCEPLHTRIDIVKRLPGLARVSVSPWADEPAMAEACGEELVYSRKPAPSLISTERFDEDALRADLRATLDAARGCRIELVMKDVHTLNNEPGRLARWVALAREVIDQATG